MNASFYRSIQFSLSSPVAHHAFSELGEIMTFLQSSHHLSGHLGLRFVFNGSLSLDLGLLLLGGLSCCLLLRDDLDIRFGLSRRIKLDILELWVPYSVNFLLFLNVFLGALNIIFERDIDWVHNVLLFLVFIMWATS